jgi:hypothetical protein
MLARLVKGVANRIDTGTSELTLSQAHGGRGWLRPMMHGHRRVLAWLNGLSARRASDPSEFTGKGSAPQSDKRGTLEVTVGQGPIVAEWRFVSCPFYTDAIRDRVRLCDHWPSFVLFFGAAGLDAMGRRGSKAVPSCCELLLGFPW